MLEKVVKVAALAAGTAILAQTIDFVVSNYVPLDIGVVGDMISYTEHFFAGISIPAIVTSLSLGVRYVNDSIFNRIKKISDKVNNSEFLQTAVKFVGAAGILGLLYYGLGELQPYYEGLFDILGGSTTGYNLSNLAIASAMALLFTIQDNFRFKERNVKPENNVKGLVIIASLLYASTSLAHEFKQAYSSVYDGPARGYLQTGQILSDFAGIITFYKASMNIFYKKNLHDLKNKN